mmetsp:Transcript_16463/g.57560  ORF Transcript_16463/g.57560 Transcript_16463/m.57560 type:complete len:476 (-) Transcript_16463:92-1519(-)
MWLPPPPPTTKHITKLEAEILCGPDKENCKAHFAGVNLDGWLVLQADLLPGMMDGADDEWTFIHRLGGPSAQKAVNAMHEHWGSFVTEDDLDRLQKFGITHCRIPIGYWLLDYDVADGYLDGGERYLFRLLAWLKQRNMQAVLDLHALPGAQAVNAPSVGRTSSSAQFFLNAALHERGRRAMEKLAELILEMDRNGLTSDVIVGMELVNEPDWDYWDTSPGIRELYEDMVPKLRKLLPKEQGGIFLSFAGPAMRSEGVEWLEAMRQEHPDDYAAVFYDAHVSHGYGDNDAPGRVWRREVDSCKTCCRDPPLLQPLVRAGLPIVIGEYSVDMGFDEGDSAFALEYFSNQRSLWASAPGIVGSFFWNFKVVPKTGTGGKTEGFSPRRTSLLDLIRLGAKADSGVPLAATSSSAGAAVGPRLCPDKDLNLCPSIFPGNVLWTDECHWQLQQVPSISDQNDTTLVPILEKRRAAVFTVA